jgi:hypothetical protein
VLLGSFAAVQTSNAAESNYLKTALINAGDQAGTVNTTTTSTVLDNAFKAEAGQAVATGSLAGDMAYILGAIGSVHVANDYAGLIAAIGNSAITAPNFQSAIGGIATAFASSSLPAVDSPTLVADLSNVANKLNAASSIQTIASNVASSLSAANFAKYIASITLKATIGLTENTTVYPHPDPSAIPAMAMALAQLATTSSEDAIIATKAVLSGTANLSLDATTISDVEAVAIAATPSAAGREDVASMFTKDLPSLPYAEDIALTAVTSGGVVSATEAGAIGASISQVTGLTKPSGPPAIALVVTNAVGFTTDNVFDVAAAFAAVGGTGTGQLPLTDLEYVSQKLIMTATGGAFLETPLLNPGATSDRLVANIAGAFVAKIANTAPGGVLTAADQTYIKTILTQAIAADPNAGPDVLGYVLEAVSVDTNTPNYLTLLSNLKSTADNADTSATALAVLEMIYPGQLDSLTLAQQKTFVDNILGTAFTNEQLNQPNTQTGYSYTLSEIGLATVDETPVTDL